MATLDAGKTSFKEYCLDELFAADVKAGIIKQNWDKQKGKVILDSHNICPLEGVYHI